MNEMKQFNPPADFSPEITGSSSIPASARNENYLISLKVPLPDAYNILVWIINTADDVEDNWAFTLKRRARQRNYRFEFAPGNSGVEKLITKPPDIISPGEYQINAFILPEDKILEIENILPDSNKNIDIIAKSAGTTLDTTFSSSFLVNVEEAAEVKTVEKAELVGRAKITKKFENGGDMENTFEITGPSSITVEDRTAVYSLEPAADLAEELLVGNHVLVWVQGPGDNAEELWAFSLTKTEGRFAFHFCPWESDEGIENLIIEPPDELMQGTYIIRSKILKSKEYDDLISIEADPRVKSVHEYTGEVEKEVQVTEAEEEPSEEPQLVKLQRTYPEATPDMVLWELIRRSSWLLGFENMDNMITEIMCNKEDKVYHGVKSYEQLRDLIDKIMLWECFTDDEIVMRTGPNGITLKVNKAIFRTASANILHSTPDGEYPQFETLYRPKDIGTTYNPRYEPTQEMVRKFVNNCSQTGIQGLLIPYLKHIYNVKKMPEPTASECRGVLESRMSCPLMIELIWSYWNEECMLVQSLNAICLRFQNKKWRPGADPLERLNINPLRRLSNLMWGYIQDEQNRLSVKRRAYEYDHHYGFTLDGKAVPTLQPADSRTNFTEAFHRLLYLCSMYFKEVDDTTVVADAFPIKNALREVHLILAEGAHNQYGDLPWTARREMLIEQWLLARPEMKEFLGGRVMVPYRESWMEVVDTMKKMHGWSDTSVEQYGILARRGEQVLLSIRFGDWNSDSIMMENAANWANYWREDIQEYVHAYRAVTGVDLTDAAQVDGTPPSVHLVRRLAKQRKAM